MGAESRFLMVSNGRSGSTWLEFMFNALPDVTADLEINWIDKAISPGHGALRSAAGGLLEILQRIEGATPVVGSKLTFMLGDEISSPIEQQRLIDSIDKSVRIVHLSRNYLDCVLSKIRHGHLRNPDGHRGPRHCDDFMNDRANPFPPPLVQSLKLNKSLIEYRVRLAYQADKFARSLRDHFPNFVSVDYANVNSNFERLARFIGSRASVQEIEDVVRRPPSKKLPKIDYWQIVENFCDVKLIGDQFEVLRQELLADSSSSAKLEESAINPAYSKPMLESPLRGVFP